jgi:hypothetical protein
MSAETRRQHETMNQNETTNHNDERKLPAIPVREEEDDEALSQATTLTQNSVAGAIPPTDTANVEIVTSVPVVCQATQSLGLIVAVIDGCRVDDDTVDQILGEAEDENDDSYASCSVYHPELNQDDDEECPASPMRYILLRNRSVGVDLPAPVVDPPSLPVFAVARGRGQCRGRAGQASMCGPVVEPPSLPVFAVARGRGRRGGLFRGRAPTLPEEDWPDYSRLLEFIKKNKQLQVVNGVPPPDSLEDGKIVAIGGKRGTWAHKNKYEMCFEYSSFKPVFMKRDVIERFLVEGDFAPKQSTLPPSEFSIESRGGSTSSRACCDTCGSCKTCKTHRSLD